MNSKCTFIVDATECPRTFQRYSALYDTLKSMTGIKPTVLQHLATIRDKFPCNKLKVPSFLQDFVRLFIIILNFF